MKNFAKFLTIVMIVFAFSTASHAQVSATANATAEIVTPLTLTKTVDLNFGKFSVSAAGTVVVSPAGARTQTGGCTLLGGTVAAASFNVTGTNNAQYVITLPVSSTITLGATNITLNTFVSNPATPGTLSAAGAQTFTVGATLNALGTEGVGVYTGTFNVSVNYN